MALGALFVFFTMSYICCQRTNVSLQTNHPGVFSWKIKMSVIRFAFAKEDLPLPPPTVACKLPVSRIEKICAVKTKVISKPKQSTQFYKKVRSSTRKDEFFYMN